MAYHAFKDEQGNEFGSFEVFHEDGTGRGGMAGEDAMPRGWYWWACFPGCLPDGEPNGPFATEEDAINDARENA